MIRRLSLPDPVGKATLAFGAAVWTGIYLARYPILGLGLAACLVLVGVVREPLLGVLALAVALGIASAAVAATRSGQVELVDGPVTVLGRASSDPLRGSFLYQPEAIRLEGAWVAWDGPRLAVSVDDANGDAKGETKGIEAGQTVELTGRLAPGGGRLAGRAFQGRVHARSVVVVDGEETPLVAVANGVRHRVASGLEPWGDHPGAALVSGFLIGDTRALSAVDYDVLRRAGLTHFVAVSGSNVALFLGLWWLVSGPLAMGPRRRAVFGILGLAIFVIVTRWEPSVLRASVMAGLLLVSRAAGISLSGWSVLGVSVTGLLLWSAELAGSVGFQLSVAATVGVMGFGRAFSHIRPGWFGSALSVTLGAQLAVAPLLLFHFGTLPVLSPIANVVAAPLVAAATATGGIGLLVGADPITHLAVGLASVVLDIAHLAADWPQVGWLGFAMTVAGAVALGNRVLRPAVMVGAVLFAVITVTAGGRPVGAALVVLDVGQGDAILVFGPRGEVILVDGGPDAPLLLAGLRRYDVERIDLLILSHPHADHLAGMLDVVDRYPIGVFWHPGSPEPGVQFSLLERDLAGAGVPMRVSEPGDRFQLGDIVIEVLGPLRRYDNLNDQSVVVRVTINGTVILLAGDVERLAQQELGEIEVDILKVPHHGSATSDLDWLVATGASTAVIPVGENTFGHPDPEVIGTLAGAGMRVMRTDLDGDVLIRLPIPESPP